MPTDAILPGSDESLYSHRFFWAARYAHFGHYSILVCFKMIFQLFQRFYF